MTGLGGMTSETAGEWEKVLVIFAAEAERLVSSMEEGLIALEVSPADDLLPGILRGAHTLKGAAGSLGFQAVTDYTHGVEDLLQALLDRRLTVNEERVSLLLGAVDHLRDLSQASLAGVDSLGAVHKAHLALLKSAASAHDSVAAAPAPPVPLSLPRLPEARGATRGRSRMDLERLDRIVTLTAELSVARGRMTQFLTRAEGTGASWEDALAQQREMDPLFEELQEEVMKVRMVPVGPLFRQHLRTVRDLARSQQKLALLELEGEDATLDTAVLDALRDPLLHLLRNALDHGIESPDERRAAGKEPRGLLRLKAYHDAGSVVVELSDDGRGIQRERVRERARQRGLVAAPERLRDDELLRLIFEPGFSTADAVTELSGRGVGMDVVRRDIEALRGSVCVQSQEGRGTTMTLRLPLTLAVIQGFAMGVGDQVYVVPIQGVQECMEVPADERSSSASGVLSLRGQPLPYLRLREVFGLGGELPARENVVVLKHPDGVIGLAVDELQGEGQRVIRPLGKLFQGVPGISGSTILGDGRVGLLLDTPTLVRRAILRASAPAEAPSSPQDLLPPSDAPRALSRPSPLSE